MASYLELFETGHGNSSEAGGGHSGGGHGGDFHPTPAQLAQAAKRLHYNTKAATYFAASICGIIALFVFLHWTRRLVNRSFAVPVAVNRPVFVVSRGLRNLLVRGAPGFNSSGHGLLVALYVAINLVLLLTDVDRAHPGPLASRFGWVLMSNLCFVVFLALKNTPLAYLTAYSYERLNNLHQVAGCTTFLLMVAHAVTYTVFFFGRGAPRVLREERQIAGIVAGFLFLVMVSSALLLRRYAYEVFYMMHLTAFVGAMIAIGFHRPDFATRAPIVTCITASLFVADHVLRIVRLLINVTNNTATVYPLANGGTRILLAKKPPRAVPGKHVLLWMPGIRALETHPFTIINTKPTEFVVKSYNGFTRKLHAYAVANPGGTLMAAAEGPYGTFPDPMEYDKIILIAGGSGASYTFGLAVNMLDRMDAESSKNIVFIWAARTRENLTWFAEHLETLRTHPNAPKVHVSLYVTRAPGSSSSEDNRSVSTAAAPGPAGAGAAASAASTGGTATSGTAGAGTLLANTMHSKFSEKKEQAASKGEKRTAKSASDLEKAAASAKAEGTTIETVEAVEAAETAQSTAAGSYTNSSESVPLQHAFSSGRPDAAVVIVDAVSSTARTQRVLVAACGPPALMKTVRNATANCITSNGPSVELHCEQFGW